jgi:hypothetical protein
MSVTIGKRHHKTLKNKIHNYIYRQQDICCEDDNINRKEIIKLIIEKYKIISQRMFEPDEYLSFINNDFLLLLQRYKNVEKKYQASDTKLLNNLDKKMYTNKILDQTKIEKILYDVPLYLLLSFLGYASLREYQLPPI